MLVCGKTRKYVHEYIFEKEHFEAHNLAPKARVNFLAKHQLPCRQ